MARAEFFVWFVVYYFRGLETHTALLAVDPLCAPSGREFVC